jgi:cytochrome c oxidase assembly factor CtaG
MVAFYLGGLGALVIATMSFIGVYQGVLFYIRSVQTILLLLVVPLFTALGRPLSLIIAAFPQVGRRIEAAIRSRTARVLTFPAITTMVLVIVPFVLYFSPWYAASMQNAAVRELTYLALLAPGFVFFWMFLRVDPVPRAYPYLVGLWVSAAEVVGDAVLGLASSPGPTITPSPVPGARACAAIRSSEAGSSGFSAILSACPSWPPSSSR